jgi:hypothetical protein
MWKCAECGNQVFRDLENCFGCGHRPTEKTYFQVEFDDAMAAEIPKWVKKYEELLAQAAKDGIYQGGQSKK